MLACEGSQICCGKEIRFLTKTNLVRRRRYIKSQCMISLICLYETIEAKAGFVQARKNVKDTRTYGQFCNVATLAMISCQYDIYADYEDIRTFLC